MLIGILCTGDYNHYDHYVNFVITFQVSTCSVVLEEVKKDLSV